MLSPFLYNINLQLQTGKTVTGLSNPKPVPLRNLVSDISPTFRLTFLESDNVIADLTGMEISLAIGEQDPKPENGYWYLTDGTNTTYPIPAQANAADIVSAINDSGIFSSGVEVNSGGSTNSYGDWVITHLATGEVAAIGGDFNGTLATSNLSIQSLDQGSTYTHATLRIQIIQEPAFLIKNDEWTLTSPSPSSTLSVLSTGSTSIYKLEIDSRAQAGIYQLTLNGDTTPAIRPNASALQLENILKFMVGGNLQSQGVLVEAHPLGGFLITLNAPLTDSTPTFTVDDSNLIIPPYWEAKKELKSEAFSELLEGVNYKETNLEIRLKETSSGSESSYIFPLVIKDPVIRDTPTDSMSGLSGPILDEVRLYSPFTDLWYPVTSSLDGSGDPILTIGTGDSIEGENPVLIKHISTTALYTLHIGSGGGILVAYYGDDHVSSQLDLNLKIDASNHTLVEASGSIIAPALTLTKTTS